MASIKVIYAGLSMIDCVPLLTVMLVVGACWTLIYVWCGDNGYFCVRLGVWWLIHNGGGSVWAASRTHVTVAGYNGGGDISVCDVCCAWRIGGGYYSPWVVVLGAIVSGA